ncbi:ECF transporter S component [Clostridium sp. D2Q-11]|uniref:ECF transporter S component n=1 Tax=Anaeromonas frigoriresistens TaxID=2683708 RepID=A0A942UZ32_9FIRM|nr:ECF transporter S component [Anaeromonas frigoriresistens]MBS4537107.1 ECF transporter S component [Anaeromonas frigoriresistens]
MYTKDIVLKGLLIALVVVATIIIPIPVPFTEGYIHAGDSIIFISGILFGWRFGLVAGGIGSAMADMILGYNHWILPTLIIKGLMGAIIGFLSNDINKDEYLKYKNLIIISITIVWISIVSILRYVLNRVLSNISNGGENVFNLNELELENTQEFIQLVQRVNTYLGISLIIIPFVILFFYFLKRKNVFFKQFSTIIGIFMSGLWMVVGYYIAGGLLKGNMIIPMFSIPANILQFVVGGVIAYFLIITLDRIEGIKKYLR